MGKVVGLTFNTPKTTPITVKSENKPETVLRTKSDTEKTSSRVTTKNTNGGDE